MSLKALPISFGRTYASHSHLAQLPKPGDKIYGFTVQRTKKIPELELTAVQLKHDTTGADYIHVARDDKNNVFSLGFKTNPTDSTGTPHILEHVALCGSKKYPVRDPFFKMLNRSLSYVANVLALMISLAIAKLPSQKFHERIHICGSYHIPVCNNKCCRLLQPHGCLPGCHPVSLATGE